MMLDCVKNCRSFFWGRDDSLNANQNLIFKHFEDFIVHTGTFRPKIVAQFEPFCLEYAKKTLIREVNPDNRDRLCSGISSYSIP